MNSNLLQNVTAFLGPAVVSKVPILAFRFRKLYRSSYLEKQRENPIINSIHFWFFTDLIYHILRQNMQHNLQYFIITPLYGKMV